MEKMRQKNNSELLVRILMRAGLPRELALTILGLNTLRIDPNYLDNQPWSMEASYARMGSRMRAAERERGLASFTPRGWGTIQ